MRYKEYKKVDIPWLDEVPSHWKIKNVNNLFDERREKVSDKDYPPLSVTKNGILPQLENVAKSMASDNRKKVLKGDFVINSRSDRKGSSGLSSYDGSVSLISTVIKPRLGFNKFWHYLLKSNDFIEEFYRNGKGIVADLWTTNFQSMKSIILPVPPKEEQEQIARFLDWKINEIDRLIELEKQKIKKLEINFTRIINDIFNEAEGEKVKLKCIFDFGKGLDVTKDDLYENGIKCISYGEVHGKNRFSFSSDDKNLKCLGDHVKLNEFAKLDQGDFVFCDTSEDLEGSGNFSYKKDSGIVYASYHTIVAKPKVNFNSEYIAYFFESDLWRTQIRRNVKGIKVYSITQSILKESNIILPDIVNQKKIAIILNNLDIDKNKMINSINMKINNLKFLKKSLISDVVTGKIDVRNVIIPEYDKVSDIEDDAILEDNFNEEV